MGGDLVSLHCSLAYGDSVDMEGSWRCRHKLTTGSGNPVAVLRDTHRSVPQKVTTRPSCHFGDQYRWNSFIQKTSTGYRLF